MLSYVLLGQVIMGLDYTSSFAVNSAVLWLSVVLEGEWGNCLQVFEQAMEYLIPL